jgi:hypothetical protein
MDKTVLATFAFSDVAATADGNTHRLVPSTFPDKTYPLAAGNPKSGSASDNFKKS